MYCDKTMRERRIPVQREDKEIKRWGEEWKCVLRAVKGKRDEVIQLGWPCKALHFLLLLFLKIQSNITFSPNDGVVELLGVKNFSNSTQGEVMQWKWPHLQSVAFKRETHLIYAHAMTKRSEPELFAVSNSRQGELLVKTAHIDGRQKEKSKVF